MVFACGVATRVSDSVVVSVDGTSFGVKGEVVLMLLFGELILVSSLLLLLFLATLKYIIAIFAPRMG